MKYRSQCLLNLYTKLQANVFLSFLRLVRKPNIGPELIELNSGYSSSLNRILDIPVRPKEGYCLYFEGGVFDYNEARLQNLNFVA